MRTAGLTLTSFLAAAAMSRSQVLVALVIAEDVTAIALSMGDGGPNLEWNTLKSVNAGSGGH